jgi:hypothetical protein
MAHHAARSTASIFTVNADTSSTARLIDIYGSMSRVDVGNGRCTVVTTKGDQWTETSVDAHDVSGVIEFRTAQSQPDGSVVAHAESWAASLVRVSEIRIAPDGAWASETERRHPDGWLARTRASGALSAIDEGVSLERLRLDKNGNELWKAAAQVTYDDFGPNRSTRWLTNGNIEFASGGVGEFQTISTSKGVTGGGTWKPFPTGPGAKGTQLTTTDADGTERTTIRIDYDSGLEEIRNITSKGTKGPGASGSSQTDTTITIYDKNHQKSYTSSDRESESIGPDGNAQWEKSHTDANGKTETDRGVYQKGDEGTQSVTTSHVNKDGSGSITTTTWDADGNATRHTTDWGTDGTRTDHDSTGTIEPFNYARFPGDAGDGYFKPDPRSSGGEDHPSGQDNHPSGNDDHPENPDEGEGTASDDYGDGDMGSDTGGGTPGLGWDGGGEGPLALLPDHGAGVLGGGVEGIDTTGQDTVAGLISQALKHVVAQGGSGGYTGDSGFGEDVTGSNGVVIIGTNVGHVGLASTDGEWGDFTDPKATLDFVHEVVTSIAHTGHETAIQTAGIVSTVSSVSARVARARSAFGR